MRDPTARRAPALVGAGGFLGVKAGTRGAFLSPTPGEWLEIPCLPAPGPVADTTGWYVMGGYRFGSFLPYLSFSKLKVDEVNVPTNTGLPGALGTNAQALQSTQYIAQKTTSVGVRWDAMRNTAVKLQFDRVQKPANSNGLFLVENPTATADKAFQSAKKNINVISLAVDFVF